ncbi:MAG: hypothetical protein Q8T11_09840 [Elusimicrobiota bacterium]|nr:hypothetical protein [Elusimicrobiota bacterium]
MFFPLIYWVVMPLFFAWLVVLWLKKSSPHVPTPEAAALFAERPIEPKWFRAARRDPGGSLRWLGDFEKQPEAVEAAYAGKEAAVAAGEKAAFLVFNDKAELLEQVDS